MKFLKDRKKVTFLISFAIGLINISQNTFINSNAVSTREYYLKGVSSHYKDIESPPAYTIFGSEYFEDGTILYKQTYRGVTYYSPKPPEQSEEAVKASKEYINWGFWDFPENQKVFNGFVKGKDVLFESSIHFEQARVNSDVTVYGTKVSDSHDSKYDLGKIEAGTIVNVMSVTDYGTVWVYFDLTGLKNTNGEPLAKSGFLPVGRIKKSSVTPIGEVKKIYFDESKNRRSPLRYIYDNFKPYSKKEDSLNDSSHRNLELATTVVPQLENDTYNLSGKAGEWRYLGLNQRGEPLINPYFPSDSLHFRGNCSMNYYDWRYTPWDGSDPENNERVAFSGASRLNMIKYDAKYFIDEYGDLNGFNTEPKYMEEKRTILQEFKDKGELTDTVDRLMNKFLLSTNPKRDTIVMVGQRRAGTASRRVISMNNTRELYLYRMTIRDVEGNVVAQGTRSSKYKPFEIENANALNTGSDYVCEITLANGSNSPMIMETLQANFGWDNDDSSLNKVRPFYNISNRQSLEIGNSGGLTNSINSKSNLFKFKLSIPEDYEKDYIDLYGYVGQVHSGVDNLDYSNDSGAIRLNVSHVPRLAKGDISVSSIELIDSKNNVVYRKKSDGTVDIKNAPKPGESYSIRYTAKYSGPDRLYYEWVPPIPDNPATTTNEYVEGYFNGPIVRKYEVPIEYSYTRKVKDTLSADILSETGKFVDANNSTSIPMKNNTTMTYTIPNVVFEHPYIDTYFKISSSNTDINKTTSNDMLSTVINDKYDISISNLKVLPHTEYIGDKNKNISYTVVYDAKLVVPSFVSTNDYRTQINTSINVNGVRINVIDQLQIGMNKNITHVVENVPVNPMTSSISSSVSLNYDRASYESGDYSNNLGSTVSSIEKIKDPLDGKSSDTASNVNNSSNNVSPNRGGDANNNCLIPRTLNTWKNSYTIKTWSATPITYKINSTNENHTYYKYNLVSSKTDIVESEERFIIKKVLYKSKSTTDKNLGVNKDGWVDLASSTEKNNGLIKAGYGFELKIVTEYRTNAELNNPTWATDKINGGTTVTNLNSKPNLVSDIFVELPGDTRNRKVLSVSGYGNTIQGLQVKQTKSGQVERSGNKSMKVYEWEYTIKPSVVVGISSTEKIYIPQNLKDGNYKVSIYTPPITGSSSIDKYNTSKYSSLCDRKDVKIKVQGSSTDDLNSHITQ